MKKKLLVATIITSFILVGCGKTSPTSTTQKSKENSSSSVNTTEQNEQTSSSVNDSNQNEQSSSASSGKSQGNTTPSNAIDYSQYVKKTWIKKENTNDGSQKKVYFSISKIENGKVTGKFNAISFDSADGNLLGFTTDFDGIINKDTAECQYKDSRGNKGNIKLVFKANNKMEATITLVDKSSTTIQPPKGTFEFAPDNIKNIRDFTPIENQSFMVNLNSWSNVKFVSGKIESGNHVLTTFYLTNKDGDIFYQFESVLPYSVDVKAVSFQDVNKDGLKDIIIIAVDNYDGSGWPIAVVYLQKSDGSFNVDPGLNQDINTSKNNKDVKTVTDYLSKRF